MGAVDLLNQQGLSAELDNDRLQVFAASRITPEWRQWIKANKSRIVAEIMDAASSGTDAMNDPSEKRSRAWRVKARGCMFDMIAPEPCTRAYAEARARMTWPGAEVYADTAEDR